MAVSLCRGRRQAGQVRVSAVIFCISDGGQQYLFSVWFAYTTAGSTVLLLYSHKSAIMQFQHCGLRAMQV